MSTNNPTWELRSEIDAHLVSLEALVKLRARLLQNAAQSPSALAAAALRLNREAADAVRKSSRRARARLGEAEMRKNSAPNIMLPINSRVDRVALPAAG